MSNTNPRPKLNWAKNMLFKLVEHFDVNWALSQERKAGKQEGVELATLNCLKHGYPVRKRDVSPGVQVCDQCQLDSYTQRYFEHGPNTGPIMPVVSHTGAWRKHYFQEIRPDLKTHDVTAKLKSIKTSEINYLLNELKKRMTP
jgi:hypothetical protein